MSVVAYGIAQPEGGQPRAAAWVRGEWVDLQTLRNLGLVEAAGLPANAFTHVSLNPFMAAGPTAWHNVYQQMVDVDPPMEALLDPGSTDLLLPIEVADYVDFYASEYHASNMGKILRPDTPALPPAWRHLPIAYHGRSATIVVSGSDIPRPSGILRGSQDGDPRFAPSERLDVEVELGFVVGVGSERGTSVATGAARDHVFGAVVVNDWSARDIQAFEYQPLGPFLGKSFATSISAWVIPIDALADRWVDGLPQDPLPLGHLVAPEPRGLDLEFALAINGTEVARTNARHLYWSMSQQLAHMTSNGAATRTGDLFASGTISGPTAGSMGSLMELSWGGATPIEVGAGQSRTYLDDGDVATIRLTTASYEMAEVSGRIVPAR